MSDLIWVGSGLILIGGGLNWVGVGLICVGSGLFWDSDGYILDVMTVAQTGSATA